MLLGATLCIAVPGYGQHSSNNCAGECQTVFGYPSAGGHANGLGGGHHARKQRREEWKLESEKIYQRNNAWPKPFSCLDRTAYHAVFPPMINAGYEIQCVLGSQHFDQETQELNSFGQTTIASIMQNMPSHRKHVYVTQDADERITARRLDEVNHIVNTYYGQLAPNAIVAASTLQPGIITGNRAEAIARNFTESSPAPVVPLQTSGSSLERSQGR